MLLPVNRFQALITMQHRMLSPNILGARLPQTAPLTSSNGPNTSVPFLPFPT